MSRCVLQGAVAFALVEEAVADNMLSVPAVSTNGFQLRLALSGSDGQQPPLGGFVLAAKDGVLLTDSVRASVLDQDAWPAGIGRGWLGLKAGAPNAQINGQSVRVIDRLLSNQWEYASVDLGGCYPSQASRFVRHLLFVAPDLYVAFDDVELKSSARVPLVLSSPGRMSFDSRSGDLRSEMDGAAVTTRVLVSGQPETLGWQSLSSGPAPESAPEPPQTFLAVSSNSLTRVRILVVMVPRLVGQKRGTGFKLLESDSAFGARIWRDGLPTLVAFRTVAPGEEASLAMMPVPGPVAVDVFDPRPRPRKAR